MEETTQTTQEDREVSEMEARERWRERALAGLTPEERERLKRDLAEEHGEAIKAATVIVDNAETVKEGFQESWQVVADAFKDFHGVTDPEGESVAQQIAIIMQEAKRLVAQRTEADAKIEPLLSSDAWKEIEKLYPDAGECLRTMRIIDPVFTLEVLNQISGLLPEFQSYAKENAGAKLADILNGEFSDPDESGEYHSIFRDFLKHAEERANETFMRIPPRKHDLPVLIPTDKINDTIFTMTREDNGQTITADMTSAAHKKAGKIPVYAWFSSNFDAAIKNGLLGAGAPPLDQKDKDIYWACVTMQQEGRDVVSFSQIYTAMGGNGTPGASDRKEINDRVEKMSLYRFHLWNVKTGDEDEEGREGEADHYNYPRFNSSGYFFPAEVLTATAPNGEIIEGAVHFLKILPIGAFSIERGNVTSISANLLHKFPMKRSAAVRVIEKVLYARISEYMHGSGNNKIRYDYIFEKIEHDVPKSPNRNTNNQRRKRWRADIKKVLDFFKDEGLIKGYEEYSETKRPGEIAGVKIQAERHKSKNK